MTKWQWLQRGLVIDGTFFSGGGGTEWLTSDKTTPKINSVKIILFGVHKPKCDVSM